MPLKKNKCTGWQVRGSLESHFTEVPGGPFLSLPPALYRSLSPFWTARSALPSDRLKNSADICVRVAKTQSKSRGKGQGGRSQSHNFRLCLFPLAWDLNFSLVLRFKRITHAEQNYYKRACLRQNTHVKIYDLQSQCINDLCCCTFTRYVHQGIKIIYADEFWT